MTDTAETAANAAAASPAVFDVDVVIVGAGISGISAACRVSTELPGLTYTVLERRQQIGGTWDLFRYPGIRSDSDMLTFGFDFRPWNDTKILADGTSIREYVVDTAREFGVTDRIRFGRKMVRASWSSDEQRWSVETLDEATGAREIHRGQFLIMGTGYYDYDAGYRPEFPGETSFGGQVIHPQHWPADLDYTGKRVVIIGSGATAITLVPAMAPTAGPVTMLQRSPSYILSLPANDKVSALMRKVLPDALVYKLSRGRNIAAQRLIYALARYVPGVVKKFLLTNVRVRVGSGVDMANFTPGYEPWDQRLCIIPDADMFTALREGKADIVTDTIDTFTPEGIRLASGRTLAADIVVAATGLTVQMAGGAELVVDGEPVNLRDRLTYKAVMVEGVPNAGLIFGYINASWTLKADASSVYLTRLIEYMRANGYTEAVAHAQDADRTPGSVLGALNAGYVKRGDAKLPRQGSRGPWKVVNDYLRDAPMLRRAAVDDGVLAFSRVDAGAATAGAEKDELHASA